MIQRSTLAFVVANVVGIAIFLFVASNYWVEPELASVPGANVGSAFGWIVFAAPIPLMFLLGGAVWTTFKIAGAKSPDRVLYCRLSLAVLALWAVAYSFDNAHHGM